MPRSMRIDEHSWHVDDVRADLRRLREQTEKHAHVHLCERDAAICDAVAISHCVGVLTQQRLRTLRRREDVPAEQDVSCEGRRLTLRERQLRDGERLHCETACKQRASDAFLKDWRREPPFSPLAPESESSPCQGRLAMTFRD